MSEETTYYKRKRETRLNRETILNRAKEYYKNNKEVLREQARNKYRELSKEEKKQKDMEEIDIEICQTKKTQRLKEHQKHYRD